MNNLLASVLLTAATVALAALFYTFSQSLLAGMFSSSVGGSNFSVFTAELALLEYNAEDNTTTIHVYLRNVSDAEIPLRSPTLSLVDSAGTVTSNVLMTSDCNSLSPKTVCVVSAGLNGAVDAEYGIVSASGIRVYVPISQTTVSTAPIDLYVDSGAFFEDVYNFSFDTGDGHAVFGDRNAFNLDVNICSNVGSASATVSASTTTAALATTSLGVTVPAGGCTLVSFDGNTLDANVVEVVVTVSAAGDTNAQNNSRSFSARVSQYYECSSCSECSSELVLEGNTLTRGDSNAPAVVVLAADIDTPGSYCIDLGDSSIDYTFVNFDGNGHDVNAGTDSFYLDPADNITVKNTRALSSVEVYYSDNVTFRDVNILVDGSFAVYLEGSNGISFERTTMAASSFVVYVFQSSVSILDSNISASGDYAVFSDDVFDPYDLNIIRSTLYSANNSAIMLDNGKARISETNAFAGADWAVDSTWNIVGGDAVLLVDVTDGNSYIRSAGYDYYVEFGDLNVVCAGCANGNVLETNFLDVDPLGHSVTDLCGCDLP